jgi:hypothetical protein
MAAARDGSTAARGGGALAAVCPLVPARTWPAAHADRDDRRVLAVRYPGAD